jgi:RimJ/RimL family protein N-acetyltransferase
MWVHGAAQFDLVIGDPTDWEQFAPDALRLGLHYAFDEMNLFRVSVEVQEHHELSRALYTSAQFFLEVRQRQAVFHLGRYWDLLLFGMLRPEWTIYHRQQLGVAA